jgi:hypothetical protein
MNILFFWDVGFVLDQRVPNFEKVWGLHGAEHEDTTMLRNVGSYLAYDIT